MEAQDRPNETQQALTFLLVGDVDHREFVPWMERHARKLGVGFTVVQQSSSEMKLHAIGAPEMTHAFALACSLGPESVHVDRLQLLENI